jgi:hypothetical protein
MKKFLFLFLTLGFLISCSTTSDNDSADQIIGEWVWIESSGGIAGSTETPQSTEKEITLEISNNSIQQFINGSLEFNRPYNIERKESVIFGGVREMIVYDNGFRQIFSTTGNRLILTGDCNDCFQAVYERK